MTYYDITWASKMTFLKGSGDLFFDLNDCRLALWKGPQNFLKSLLVDFFQDPKMVQNYQKRSKTTSGPSPVATSQMTSVHPPRGVAKSCPKILFPVATSQTTLAHPPRALQGGGGDYYEMKSILAAPKIILALARIIFRRAIAGLCFNLQPLINQPHCWSSTLGFQRVCC